ncbi:MAG: hypothetical protein AAGC55_29665, partial [Myxococcota bacterium]
GMGESSIGIVTTASYRNTGYWTLSAGLILRSPGTGGVVSPASVCEDEDEYEYVRRRRWDR